MRATKEVVSMPTIEATTMMSSIFKSTPDRLMKNFCSETSTLLRAMARLINRSDILISQKPKISNRTADNTRGPNSISMVMSFSEYTDTCSIWEPSWLGMKNLSMAGDQDEDFEMNGHEMLFCTG